MKFTDDISRREFLAMAAGTGVALSLGGCATSAAISWEKASAGLQRLSYGGLATSLPQERSYRPAIEGKLPAGLSGTLYRNGPALFDRNGLRKRIILDGDGMVQRFNFGPQGVSYTNRFVRTPKFRDEEKAGRFVYPSWSTQAPGGIFANIMGPSRLQSQAAVTVFMIDGRLFAFDEFAYPFEIDPVTLETRGESTLGMERAATIFSAHGKRNPASGAWYFFGIWYGAKPTLHLSVIGPGMRPLHHRALAMPNYVYLHDWFVGPRHLILSLQPVEIDLWPALLGLCSVYDCLRWRPEKGNLLVLLPLDLSGEPILVEAPARFMWHTVNCFEAGGELVADFVGYDDPRFFIGPDPVVRALMEGRAGEVGAPGHLLRYRIDPAARRVREEMLAKGRLEWPRIDEQQRCGRHGAVYLAGGRQGEFFWTQTVRIDMVGGREERYDFGRNVFSSEPVFVPRPGGGADDGWLLVQGHDGASHRSFLAVFNARHVADGPLATVRLEHHVPFSYHGWWVAS